MSTTTAHYGLVKPSTTDPVNVAVLNTNFDTIDTQIYARALSVLDYGATGNGTTNDTAAVQAALTAGGAVRFPPGNYSVGTLYVSSNSVLAGEPGSKLTLRAGTVGPLLRSASPVTNVRVERMVFDGNASNNPDNDYIISLSAPTGVTLTDLTILSAPGDTITLSNAVTNCFINRVLADGLIRADRDTLVTSCRVVSSLVQAISVGTDSVVRDCLVDQGSIAGNGIHIQQNATNVKVLGNTVVARTDVIGSSAIGTSTGVTNCLIEGNMVTGGDAGIAVYGSNNRIANNHVTATGYVSPTTGDGIIINTGSGNVVVGNVLSGLIAGPGIEIQAPDTVVSSNTVTDVASAAVGVWFSNTVVTNNLVIRAGLGISGTDASGINVNGDNALVANNVVYDCGNSGAATSSGVLVGSGANAIVVGNRCTDTRSGGSKKQQYGVRQAGTSTSVTAQGNHLVGNATAATNGSFTGTPQIA